VTHVFEAAASGRSKCRGCDRLIRRGELRFGERLANLFGEGQMTVWFHPRCAAYKRPQQFLDGLRETPEPVPDRDHLERAARGSLVTRRVPRINGAERSPTSQARCRCCQQPIERGSWRIRIVYYEEGRFSPGGYVHLGCREVYFETHEILDQILHFSPDLTEEEREALKLAFDSSHKQFAG
jgi:hypothetical protein